ncbi:hypothetical protein DAEQUDRAFT_719932 [Daedalea quercina L-15889]|uniref:L-lactate dehydrogenase (cytochrome) n=1 Tax=Daedalea quercina L-15889 TaxID=1314783 RepID=A0A165UDG6_9APHY|nr:hypothetical protein DAEQUDRAFT_719932 [Daedalea quercina L-15889]
MSSKAWSLSEVAQHNTTSSCWVILHNKVYDMTEFLPDHPGGSSIILKYAGRDATAVYDPIHPPDALEKNLPPERHLGDIDTASVASLEAAQNSKRKTKDELRVEAAVARKPRINRMLCLQDIEDVAIKVMSYKTMSYYASGADDELTKRENANAFSRFFFRPRVMRPISKVDTSTTILGFKSTLPIFVSAAGLAKLGHPLGEANITRGAGRTGIIQMVSSASSLSVAQIAESRVSPTQPLFFQLYKSKDNKIAEERVREIERLDYNAIFLTVDAPVGGNRERDVRAPFELEDQEREAEGVDGASQDAPQSEDDLEEKSVNFDGTIGSSLHSMDTDMTFKETIPWLRSVTRLPIVIKGVQCVEDAVLAAEAGVDGILLSNHGGRQLDYSPPPMEVLYRIRKQRPDVFDKLEVYIDGGVKRGTDVLKALCLGATAVGLGRAFLYANSAYGEVGVVQTIRIMQREITLGMRLLGVASVKELVPEMVERVDWQPALARL